MADMEKSEAYQEFIDNRLSVDLERAYAFIGGSLEYEFDHAQPDNEFYDVPSGMAREILDTMRGIIVRINVLNIHEMRLDALSDHPKIQAVEGEGHYKLPVIELIVDGIAEAVAEAIWYHRHKSHIVDALDAAQAIDAENLAAVDAEWTALHEQLKKDFGLQ